jgi:hypothetical protein
MAARMAIIAMTTSSSMSVNPENLRALRRFIDTKSFEFIFNLYTLRM